MVSFALIAGALFAAVAIAQEPNTQFNQSILNTIIGEIPLSTRNSWCTAEVSSCGSLCGGSVANNNCTGADLTFSCICQSNNSAPALQYYVPTMTTFICNQALGDCLKNNAGSAAQQDNCKQTFICGNSSVATASVAPSSAASTSATGSATGSASAAPATDTASTTTGGIPVQSSHGAAAALYLGQNYGTGILGATFLAALGIAL